MLENSIEYRVWGKYALFTDPVTKIGGEKSTYFVPTYEALKGITNSIYWKPTFIWVIDSVRIMNKIQTEAKSIKPLCYNGGNDLSIYNYLRDVEYQVKVHFEWNTERPDLEQDRNEDKHYQVALRMLKKGGRRDIFLGARECQGYVEPCRITDKESYYDKDGVFSFGLMFHGFDYPGEQKNDMLSARFWNSSMNNGYIQFPKPEECNLKRDIKPMNPVKIAVNMQEVIE